MSVNAILVSNGNQGSSVAATASPVRINDTYFILQNGNIISMYTINPTNLELNEEFSINVSSIFNPNVSYTVNYLKGEPIIQVAFGYDALVDIGFNSEGFQVISTISLPV